MVGFEIGWLAWGIGAACGFGAAFLGGGGQRAGVIAAIIAVVAIGAGKFMGCAVSLANYDATDDEFAKAEFRKNYTPEIHAESAQASIAWANRSNYQNPDPFILEWGHDLDNNRLVSSEEREMFTSVWQPLYNKWGQTPPPFNEAQSDYVNQASSVFSQTIQEDVTVMDVVIENMGLLDIVFIALGVATAFGVANKFAPPPSPRPHVPTGPPAGSPYGPNPNQPNHGHNPYGDSPHNPNPQPIQNRERSSGQNIRRPSHLPRPKMPPRPPGGPQPPSGGQPPQGKLPPQSPPPPPWEQ